MADRKIYKRRKLADLKSSGNPVWVQFGDPEGPPLSEILADMIGNGRDKLFLCGPLDKMSREWMMEPIEAGWLLAREFVFKYRTAVYQEPDNGNLDGRERAEISVKLVSHRESWLPGCEDMLTAIPAWRVLEEEWKSTGLPLLSSPAATGKALLWETLPDGADFPALPDDLARLIRSISPQHRMEMLKPEAALDPEWMNNSIQYDGRWMYAAMCGLDRFPVGEPKRTGGFVPYQPGWHNVAVMIPETWNHIGLLPRKKSDGGWAWPFEPGLIFDTWAAEPELTLALKCGWEIVEHYDGWAFDKGRPLALWSSKLIEMRERFQWQAKLGGGGPLGKNPYDFAASAIRQILNSTIGALHKNEYEREQFVSDDNFRKWRREHPDLAESTGGWRDPVRVEGGYMVPCFVPDTSRLSIFMPHWSAQLYALARARVASWALQCDQSTLVKINGDAIYSTVEQPELDKLDTGRLGQPRRK